MVLSCRQGNEYNKSAMDNTEKIGTDVSVRDLVFVGIKIYNISISVYSCAIKGRCGNRSKAVARMVDVRELVQQSVMI